MRKQNLSLDLRGLFEYIALNYILELRRISGYSSSIRNSYEEIEPLLKISMFGSKFKLSMHEFMQISSSIIQIFKEWECTPIGFLRLPYRWSVDLYAYALKRNNTHLMSNVIYLPFYALRLQFILQFYFEKLFK